jgi:hypothetical protein
MVKWRAEGQFDKARDLPGESLDTCNFVTVPRRLGGWWTQRGFLSKMIGFLIYGPAEPAVTKLRAVSNAMLSTKVSTAQYLGSRYRIPQNDF